MIQHAIVYVVKSFLQEFIEDSTLYTDNDTFQIGILSGTFLFDNLNIKRSLFDQLDMPCKVSCCSIGRIKLVVPWTELGTSKLSLSFEDISILIQPSYIKDETTCKYVKDRKYITKQATIQSHLNSLIRDHFGDKNKPTTINSSETQPRSFFQFSYFSFLYDWLQSSLLRILNTVEVSITNIHIRYEDHITCQTPLALGFMMESLLLQSHDFYRDLVHKSDEVSQRLTIDKLSVYFFQMPNYLNKCGTSSSCPNGASYEPKIIHNNHVLCYRSKEDIMSMLQYFISTPDSMIKSNYLVYPTDCDSDLKISLERKIKQFKIRIDNHVTAIKVDVVDWQVRSLKVLSSTFNNIDSSRDRFSLRPCVPIKQNYRVWWRYAIDIVLSQVRLKLPSFTKKRFDQFIQDKRVYMRIWRRQLLLSNSNAELATSNIEHLVGRESICCNDKSSSSSSSIKSSNNGNSDNCSCFDRNSNNLYQYLLNKSNRDDYSSLNLKEYTALRRQMEEFMTVDSITYCRFLIQKELNMGTKFQSVEAVTVPTGNWLSYWFHSAKEKLEHADEFQSEGEYKEQDNCSFPNEKPMITQSMKSTKARKNAASDTEYGLSIICVTHVDLVSLQLSRSTAAFSEQRYLSNLLPTLSTNRFIQLAQHQPFLSLEIKDIFSDIDISMPNSLALKLMVHSINLFDIVQLNAIPGVSDLIARERVTVLTTSNLLSCYPLHSSSFISKGDSSLEINDQPSINVTCTVDLPSRLTQIDFVLSQLQFNFVLSNTWVQNIASFIEPPDSMDLLLPFHTEHTYSSRLMFRPVSVTNVTFLSNVNKQRAVLWQTRNTLPKFHVELNNMIFSIINNRMEEFMIIGIESITGDTIHKAKLICGNNDRSNSVHSIVDNYDQYYDLYHICARNLQLFKQDTRGNNAVQILLPFNIYSDFSSLALPRDPVLFQTKAVVDIPTIKLQLTNSQLKFILQLFETPKAEQQCDSTRLHHFLYPNLLGGKSSASLTNLLPPMSPITEVKVDDNESTDDTQSFTSFDDTQSFVSLNDRQSRVSADDTPSFFDAMETSLNSINIDSVDSSSLNSQRFRQTSSTSPSLRVATRKRAKSLSAVASASVNNNLLRVSQNDADVLQNNLMVLEIRKKLLYSELLSLCDESNTSVSSDSARNSFEIASREHEIASKEHEIDECNTEIRQCKHDIVELQIFLWKLQQENFSKSLTQLNWPTINQQSAAVDPSTYIGRFIDDVVSSQSYVKQLRAFTLIKLSPKYQLNSKNFTVHLNISRLFFAFECVHVQPSFSQTDVIIKDSIQLEINGIYLNCKNFSLANHVVTSINSINVIVSHVLTDSTTQNYEFLKFHRTNNCILPAINLKVSQDNVVPSSSMRVDIDCGLISINFSYLLCVNFCSIAALLIKELDGKNISLQPKHQAITPLGNSTVNTEDLDDLVDFRDALTDEQTPVVGLQHPLTDQLTITLNDNATKTDILKNNSLVASIVHYLQTCHINFSFVLSGIKLNFFEANSNDIIQNEIEAITLGLIVDNVTAMFTTTQTYIYPDHIFTLTISISRLELFCNQINYLDYSIQKYYILFQSEPRDSRDNLGATQLLVTYSNTYDLSISLTVRGNEVVVHPVPVLIVIKYFQRMAEQASAVFSISSFKEESVSAANHFVDEHICGDNSKIIAAVPLSQPLLSNNFELNSQARHINGINSSPNRNSIQNLRMFIFDETAFIMPSFLHAIHASIRLLDSSLFLNCGSNDTWEKTNSESHPEVLRPFGRNTRPPTERYICLTFSLTAISIVNSVDLDELYTRLNSQRIPQKAEYTLLNTSFTLNELAISINSMRQSTEISEMVCNFQESILAPVTVQLSHKINMSLTQTSIYDDQHILPKIIQRIHAHISDLELSVLLNTVPFTTIWSELCVPVREILQQMNANGSTQKNYFVRKYQTEPSSRSSLGPQGPASSIEPPSIDCSNFSWFPYIMELSDVFVSVEADFICVSVIQNTLNPALPVLKIQFDTSKLTAAVKQNVVANILNNSGPTHSFESQSRFFAPNNMDNVDSTESVINFDSDHQDAIGDNSGKSLINYDGSVSVKGYDRYNDVWTEILIGKIEANIVILFPSINFLHRELWCLGNNQRQIYTLLLECSTQVKELQVSVSIGMPAGIRIILSVSVLHSIIDILQQVLRQPQYVCTHYNSSLYSLENSTGFKFTFSFDNEEYVIGNNQTVALTFSDTSCRRSNSDQWKTDIRLSHPCFCDFVISLNSEWRKRIDYVLVKYSANSSNMPRNIGFCLSYSESMGLRKLSLQSVNLFNNSTNRLVEVSHTVFLESTCEISEKSSAMSSQESYYFPSIEGFETFILRLKVNNCVEASKESFSENVTISLPATTKLDQFDQQNSDESSCDVESLHNLGAHKVYRLRRLPGSDNVELQYIHYLSFNDPKKQTEQIQLYGNLKVRAFEDKKSSVITRQFSFHAPIQLTNSFVSNIRYKVKVSRTQTASVSNSSQDTLSKYSSIEIFTLHPEDELELSVQVSLTASLLHETNLSAENGNYSDWSSSVIVPSCSHYNPIKQEKSVFIKFLNRSVLSLQLEIHEVDGVRSLTLFAPFIIITCSYLHNIQYQYDDESIDSSVNNSAFLVKNGIDNLAPFQAFENNLLGSKPSPIWDFVSLFGLSSTSAPKSRNALNVDITNCNHAFDSDESCLLQFNTCKVLPCGYNDFENNDCLLRASVLSSSWSESISLSQLSDKNSSSSIVVIPCPVLGDSNKKTLYSTLIATILEPPDELKYSKLIVFTDQFIVDNRTSETIRIRPCNSSVVNFQTIPSGSRGIVPFLNTSSVLAKTKVCLSLECSSRNKYTWTCPIPLDAVTQATHCIRLVHETNSGVFVVVTVKKFSNSVMLSVAPNSEFVPYRFENHLHWNLRISQRNYSARSETMILLPSGFVAPYVWYNPYEKNPLILVELESATNGEWEPLGIYSVTDPQSSCIHVRRESVFFKNISHGAIHKLVVSHLRLPDSFEQNLEDISVPQLQLKFMLPVFDLKLLDRNNKEFVSLQIAIINIQHSITVDKLKIPTENIDIQISSIQLNHAAPMTKYPCVLHSPPVADTGTDFSNLEAANSFLNVKFSETKSTGTVNVLAADIKVAPICFGIDGNFLTMLVLHAVELNEIIALIRTELKSDSKNKVSLSLFVNNYFVNTNRELNRNIEVVFFSSFCVSDLNIRFYFEPYVDSLVVKSSSDTLQFFSTIISLFTKLSNTTISFNSLAISHQLYLVNDFSNLISNHYSNQLWNLVPSVLNSWYLFETPIIASQLFLSGASEFISQPLQGIMRRSVLSFLHGGIVGTKSLLFNTTSAALMVVKGVTKCLLYATDSIGGLSNSEYSSLQLKLNESKTSMMPTKDLILAHLNKLQKGTMGTLLFPAHSLLSLSVQVNDALIQLLTPQLAFYSRNQPLKTPKQLAILTLYNGSISPQFSPKIRHRVACESSQPHSGQLVTELQSFITYATPQWFCHLPNDTTLAITSTHIRLVDIDYVLFNVPFSDIVSLEIQYSKGGMYDFVDFSIVQDTPVPVTMPPGSTSTQTLLNTGAQQIQATDRASASASNHTLTANDFKRLTSLYGKPSLIMKIIHNEYSRNAESGSETTTEFKFKFLNHRNLVEILLLLYSFRPDLLVPSGRNYLQLCYFGLSFSDQNQSYLSNN